MATPKLTEASYTSTVAKAQRAQLGLNKKYINVVLTDPRGQAIATDANDGLVYAPITADLDGWELTSYTLMVSTRSSSGVVTAMARRDRAGTVVDMATTAASIDASEDSSRTGTVPTMHSTQKLVAQDDRVWFKITAAGTGAKGLTVRCEFTEV